LTIVRDVASGLVVHEAVIRRRLDRYLPFLVVEEALIAGVRKGGDRQELHERIRRHAMEARGHLDAGADDNDFFGRVAGDEAFGLDHEELAALGDAAALVGRAPEQVEQFLRTEIEPALSGFEPDAPEPLRV
jgi:adenylosuccinate lyase